MIQFISLSYLQKLTSDRIRQKSCRTIDTASTEDCLSVDDNRRDDGDDLSFDEEEGHGCVIISPFPKSCNNRFSKTSAASKNDDKETKNDDDKEISVSNQCAMCLEEYCEGETIVWSANKNCRHAFHRDCLTSYLVKVERENTYPCPCCRQNFFFDNEKESERKSGER